MTKDPVQIKRSGVSRRAGTAGSFLLLLALLLLGLSACASNTGLLGGGNWQVGALQNEHLQVLAVDPNHLQNVYAGDARDGIFVSTDAGQTWRGGSAGLPLPLAIDALSFDIPGQKLFAATSAGLFVSDDAAHSWSRAAHTPTDAFTALTFDVNAPQVVYAATAHAGVLKSGDDGASWTQIGSGLPTGAITDLLYDPGLKQLWVAFADALYRSDDNGASWHLMNTGLPASAGINVLTLGSLAVSGNGGLIFAGTNHGFFRSTDAGQHWAQSQFSLANLRIRGILIDATQPSTVYASTSLGVLRSNDDGQTWNQLATGLPSGQSFAGLAQAGAGHAQLLLTGRGVYLYPGQGGSLSSSRIVPLILILLFFFLLYYFFSLRRRRPLRRPSTNTSKGPEASAPPPGNLQNGHSPAPETAPEARPDEKKQE